MTLLPERHGNRFALSRSIDVRFPEMVDKVMGLITDPKQMATDSSAEQIAEVVYEAVRTEKEQLRYLAGDNAKRSPLGDDSSARQLPRTETIFATKGLNALDNGKSRRVTVSEDHQNIAAA